MRQDHRPDEDTRLSTEDLARADREDRDGQAGAAEAGREDTPTSERADASMDDRSRSGREDTPMGERADPWRDGGQPAADGEIAADRDDTTPAATDGRTTADRDHTTLATTDGETDRDHTTRAATDGETAADREQARLAADGGQPLSTFEDEAAPADREQAIPGPDDESIDESRHLFPTEAVERFRGEWQQIQAGFVDDPRDAVRNADHLVAEVMQSLATTFNEHKHELESQWQEGSEVETEELRLALRRYRAFFNQLLDA